ncbi:phage tail protein [Obesumbacterium proteus]|uniref:phage tail fiber protein n=1 Tax=Obesumbacterium proteus TaxID=82983 RepID=UPI00242E7D0F|nr:phage tail protein [Obesumbacterium proteus]
MSAGTITLTNNSAAVSGTGTAFTTDLKAGDFIVSVVGGVTYTLPVKTVNSATGVTLLKNYDGPTQAGAAWSAVPRDTMNAIIAQLAAEAAQALRGLNYDKQNWQQVFSATGNVTVKLPDGSSFTGPAWGSITTELAKKADKSALGTAAGVNTGVNKGNILLNKQSYNFTNSDIVPKAIGVSPGVNIMGKLFDGFYDKLLGPDNSDTGIPLPTENGTGYSYATCYSIARNRTLLFIPCVTTGNSGSLCWRGAFNDVVTPLIYTRDSRNTTVDSNGFIKKASPIIKIFSDGTCETNDESEGAQVERESVGVYRISNILGPHSDKAWGGIDGGFEIPKDRNGQRLLWLDYEVDADGSILVKTYHRTYPEAPAFARNTKNGYEESDPIDIPSDQFVSVRVEMPQDSIWNLAQKAAQEEMSQDEIAEE